MVCLDQGRPKEARPCFSFSLTSRGLLTKNSSWQAKQSVPHTAVTFYANCMNMCEDFTQNFGNKRTGWLLHHDNTPSHTSYSTREFLTKNNMTVISHPPYFPLFFQLKKKLKGHHFDIIKVSEAESQAVLNTLTDAFKKYQEHWEWSIHMEGGYFEGNGGR
jgi:uncharacterized protein YmfQ (DUF2313 family)